MLFLRTTLKKKWLLHFRARRMKAFTLELLSLMIKMSGTQVLCKKLTASSERRPERLFNTDTVREGNGLKVTKIFLQLDTNRKASDRSLRLFLWIQLRVHFTCTCFSYQGPLTVWSASVNGCSDCHCPGVVLSKMVELAGVEPASEITTPSALHA